MPLLTVPLLAAFILAAGPQPLRLILSPFTAFYRLVGFLIARQERRAFSFYTVISVCLFTGVIRGLLEGLLFGHPVRSAFVVGITAFYLSYSVLLTALLSWIGGLPYKRVFNAVMIGVFLGVFPPLIDFLATPNEQLSSLRYGYFYFWNSAEIPWSFYNPGYRWPIGETAALWATVVFSAIYMHYKTRSLWRTCAAIGAAYALVIWQGIVLPTAITVIYVRPLYNWKSINDFIKNQLTTVGYHIVLWQAFFSFVAYNFLRGKTGLHLLKRINHMAPFLIIFLVGAHSTYPLQAIAGPIFLLLLMICWAGIAMNDFFDRAEDALSGRPKTGLQADDLVAFNAFIVLAMLAFFNNNDIAFLPLIPFFVVTVLYSYPFYRGKKTFPTNVKIEAVWGGMAFLSGALTAGQSRFTMQVFLFALLIFGGWSLVVSLKDLKDIRADRHTGNKTLYLLLWRKGWRLTQIHRLLSIIVLLCLLVPAIFIAVQGHLLPAGLLAGLVIGPYIYLSFKPTKPRWFQYILLLINLYFLILFIFPQGLRG